jgi:serine/threonine protein kinase
MPIPSTIDEFIHCIRKSQLVPEEILLQCQKTIFQRADSLTLAEVAHDLVDEGVLTEFQVKQLLQGRWKRFTIAGKYRLLELLGQGGMGAVFLCEHLGVNCLRAVKILAKSKLASDEAVARFYREARVGIRLSHPNIVRTIDIDRSEDMYYLVLEFVDGYDLQRLVQQHGHLAPRRAAHYIAQAAGGLQYAHEAGMVHRDIKPGNLLLDRSGVVKILDLGLARFFNRSDENLTSMYNDDAILGTVDYLSPEQILDSSDVDIRTDIYGLGGTFYFLLTGRVPFEGHTFAEKIELHQHQLPKLPSTFRKEIPKEMEEILMKMLAKDKSKRYQLPIEIVQALTPWTQLSIDPPTADEMPKHSRVVQRILANEVKPATPETMSLTEKTDPSAVAASFVPPKKGTDEEDVVETTLNFEVSQLPPAPEENLNTTSEYRPNSLATVRKFVALALALIVIALVILLLLLH